MRVIAFPKKGISYNDCFYAALEAEGIEVVEGIFSGGWLNANLRPGDWVHLHWPSFAYTITGSRLRLIIWFARFVILLLLALIKGAKIAWTAHNLLPHDRCKIPSLDLLGRQIVIRLSDIILVHGPGPAAALQARFPCVLGKLVSIPHGHWIDYYAADIGKNEARQLLGLPLDKMLFLFIGLCKPYKNLHGLVATFHASNLDANLLVVGKYPDATYRAHIESLADKDSRIHIRDGYVPDAAMQNYLKACDFVVVPYREILTSGTAMLAISFGRPLISVDFGFLHDVITEETGILFPHDDPNGLTMALAKAMKSQYCEEAILAHARGYSFADAARIFARLLRSDIS